VQEDKLGVFVSHVIVDGDDIDAEAAS
jgi:hypothetical protein